MKTFLLSVAHPVFIVFTTIILIAILFQTKLAPVFHTTQSLSNDFSVTGEGTVAIEPDQAEISLGITSSDISVKSAQTKANTKIENVKKALQELGVKKEDIKTTNYSVNPNYNYEIQPRTIRDYAVDISLNIKIRDLSKTGEVIDAATSGGLNNINGLTFSISDRQKALDQARKIAVENAKRQAEITSKTAGLSLGKIIYYSEYEDSQNRYASPMLDKQGIGGAEIAPTPTDISPGTNEIKLFVTLTYKTL